MTVTAARTGNSKGPSWLVGAGPVVAVGTTLVLWASAFVAIRHLGDYFGPGSMTLGRMAVGSLCLTTYVAWTRSRGAPLPRPARRDWGPLVVIGVLWYAVYMIALNAGELRVDAGTASMLVQISPILVSLLAAAFLGERFTPWLVVGMTLGFAGVVVIALASEGDGKGGDLVGGMLCVVAAAAYAVSLVLQKPLSARLPALEITWLACTIGAVVCLPFAGQLAGELKDAPASAVWWLIYLGVFPTAIAFTTYGFALKHMAASQLGVTTYLVPVITIVLALAFLGEVPPALAFVGGALALAGVAVTRRRV